MGYIIDISHHQVPSAINYDTLADQLDFAIIRTQYGSRTLDRHYKTHHKELQKRGIPTAAYAWIRGVSVSDMEKEATDFYNRTKEFNPTFWFLDVEERSMPDMRKGASAFLNKLRDLGAKKVGIYIANHLYDSFNLDTSEADAVWIPHYGSNNGKPNSKPNHPADLHQYTDKGRLNGYNGPLDLNRIISDLDLTYFTDGQATKSKKASKPKKSSNKITGSTYKVKSGDTLSGIAQRAGTTTKKLQDLNGVSNPDVIQVGQTIKLEGAPKKSSGSTHKVVSGDTLSELAVEYGTTVQAIKSANGMGSDTIYVGDTLTIPGGSGKTYYTVKSGDTVSELAAEYGSSQSQIKSWNNLDNNYTIYAGDKLRVK